MEKIHPKVEEAVETLSLTSVARRRLLSGAGLVSASAAASALLAACTSGQGEPAASGGSGAHGDFPATPRWKFVLVCHVTTNPFFTPTQYGAQDACALLGTDFQWTGSKDSIVAEMVNACNTAISAKADGLAVAVVDKTAFRQPVAKALDAGIPVVSYNADGARDDKGSARLAYIGQGLYESGYALGQRAIQQVDSGEIVGFIATPGALNIQPRIDGAQQAIKDSGKPVKFTPVGTNADTTKGLSIIDAYAQGHANLAGMLAVDAGSTQSIGQTVKKYGMRSKGLKVAGGFDLVPETLTAIKNGDLDYTIDQQPYLQGFLPVLYLYLYKLSGGLLSPSETNTGLLFVTKGNVDPYQVTKSRFEGSDTAQKLVPRSGPIPHA
ncbi:sugar ABC transporter substrate-binding protein [Nonomuraea aurantiaca]|jgi:simple sugar transport system substrate-binding protein|uniref:sugar ABC transporter substrate-binding protein n=1 Tax=Nonomuraea aurantiaca TaxID=2878562 RepID=UPI001CD96DD8|nr:sugar ABC transporter substrate-binding protein [Nonomuraea aurantiaca]MCA2223993.1 sugar ABC transporter substrate-binding protein [Nonomuraea aurantiaca]